MDFENFEAFKNFREQPPILQTTVHPSTTTAPPIPTSTQPLGRGHRVRVRARCGTDSYFVDDDSNQRRN